MKNSDVVLNATKNKEKYFAVHCKCGHAGKGKYVEIIFAVKAENGKEAAEKARNIPRVKHNKKDAIIDCCEISFAEFKQLVEKNKKDPYLQCKNKQEQRLIEDFYSRIKSEEEKPVLKKTKNERKEFVKYKLKKQKEVIDTYLGSIDNEYPFEKGNENYEISF
jgi:hypothetical protein